MEISAIPASEVRDNFSEITLGVYKGDAAVVVTHHEKPFAAIIPIEKFKLWLSAEVDPDEMLKAAQQNKRTFRKKRS